MQVQRSQSTCTFNMYTARSVGCCVGLVVIYGLVSMFVTIDYEAFRNMIHVPFNSTISDAFDDASLQSLIMNQTKSPTLNRSLTGAVATASFKEGILSLGYAGLAVNISNFVRCHKLALEKIPPQFIIHTNTSYSVPNHCTIYNPYARAIHQLNRQTISKTECSSRGVNKLITERFGWDLDLKFPFDDRNCSPSALIPQYLFAFNDAANTETSCAAFTIEDSVDYFPRSGCNWSIADLNWFSFKLLNRVYARDFAVFNLTNYSTPQRQTPDVQATWDKITQYQRKYGTEAISDHPPFAISNEANVCKPMQSHYNASVAAYELKNISNSTFDSGVTVGLCTCVRNELPFLFEWIEYYVHIQKMDKLYIFNDRSVDRTKYLAYFYSKYKWNYPQVTLIPHQYGQNNAWLRCRDYALKDNITWIGITDVDEFMYSMKFETIADNIRYIHSTKPNITQITVPLTPYGSKPESAFKFRYDLNVNLSAQHCLSVNESDLQRLEDCNIELINDNEDGIETVIGKYLYRKGEWTSAPKHCKYHQQFGWRCSHYGSVCNEGSIIKSFWRPSQCVRPNTHLCGEFISNVSLQKFTDAQIMRGNHYLLRGFENFFAFGFDKVDKKVILLDTEINQFFRSAYDPYAAYKYHNVLSKRMSALLHCDTRAAPSISLNISQ